MTSEASRSALRVVSLFSGIGGLDLGLERAGMRTVGFCEKDAFAREVLRKHWPTVPQHSDVTTMRGVSQAPNEHGNRTA
jgi:DNA (cytosine-5)-methyltransferase 1